MDGKGRYDVPCIIEIYTGSFLLHPIPLEKNNLIKRYVEKVFLQRGSIHKARNSTLPPTSDHIAHIKFVDSQTVSATVKMKEMHNWPIKRRRLK